MDESQNSDETKIVENDKMTSHKSPSNFKKGLKHKRTFGHNNIDSIADDKAKLKNKKGKKRKIPKEVNSSKTEETRTLKTSQLRETMTKESKKIVFVDDEPQEVLKASNSKSNSELGNSIHSTVVEEESIRDEDIDKFCDDLDDEDNKQYEDWVKLIEVKLHEKKK